MLDFRRGRKNRPALRCHEWPHAHNHCIVCPWCEFELLHKQWKKCSARRLLERAHAGEAENTTNTSNGVVSSARAQQTPLTHETFTVLCADGLNDGSNCNLAPLQRSPNGRKCSAVQASFFLRRCARISFVRYRLVPQTALQLVEMGADPHARSLDGSTPVMDAARNDHHVKFSKATCYHKDILHVIYIFYTT